MDLHITIKIQDSDIEDILDIAFEGGINYWCTGLHIVGDCLGKSATEHIVNGGKLLVYNEDDEGGYMLTKSYLVNGIEKYISDYSNCGNIVVNGEIDTCEVDAGMADIIIQLAIFGEVIYG